MPDKEINNKLFANRHIGPRSEDIELMLTTLGYAAMEDFIDAVVPADIRLSSTFNLNGDASGLGRSLQARPKLCFVINIISSKRLSTSGTGRLSNSRYADCHLLSASVQV